jgi:hypothetical protein
MNRVTAHGSIRAVAAVIFLSACGGSGEEQYDDLGAEEVSDVELAADGYSANPGKCFHGMTTKVQKMRPPSDFESGISSAGICEIGELKEMVDWVCQSPSNAAVCDFLTDVVPLHAKLQCTRYVDSAGKKRACVDVVERFPDGSPIAGKPGFSILNFFIGFTKDDHSPMSPQVPYWDAQLAGPAAQAPVLLTTAGYYFIDPLKLVPVFSKAKPAPADRMIRALMFDPRDCGDCGIYNGPNILLLTNPNDVYSGFFPSFTPSNCRFQQSSATPIGSWKLLTPSECDAEAAYRGVGR